MQTMLRETDPSSMMADFKITDNPEDNIYTCTCPTCMLCLKGLPPCLTSNYTTWKDIAKVLLFTMQVNNPAQEYFHLKYDIYPFIVGHKSLMSIIHPKITSGTSWHKQLQDALSHDKRLFQSGIALYGKNGFWRLNECEDPWTLSDLQFKQFTMTSSPSSSPLSLSSSTIDSVSSDGMRDTDFFEEEARHLRDELYHLRHQAERMETSISHLASAHDQFDECLISDVINDVDMISEDVHARALSLLTTVDRRGLKGFYLATGKKMF